MAQTQGKTGKAGNITIAAAGVPITKWSCKATVGLADATDSGNFDSGSGNLYKGQLPGDIQCDGTIEGNWDVATTSTNITAKIKAPVGGPWPLALKIDAATTYFSGPVDLSDVDVSVEVPGATMVKFTANWKSNGTFTLT